MRVTLKEAFEMINRGETPEQYEYRIKRVRRLINEREALEDAIQVLNQPEDRERRIKKVTRLEVVNRMIEELK